MTYGVSAALQAAVFQALQGDAALAGLVGAAIFDSPPGGILPGTYVSLGPESVRDGSDQSGAGAVHVLTVSVVSDAPGFAVAKAVAGAVSDVLSGAALTLARGRLVSLRFMRAGARRIETGDLRRIDLKFRARVEDN